MVGWEITTCKITLDQEKNCAIQAPYKVLRDMTYERKEDKTIKLPTPTHHQGYNDPSLTIPDEFSKE